MVPVVPVVLVVLVVPVVSGFAVVVDELEVVPVDGSTVCGCATDAAAVSSAVVVNNVR